jgi:hypothetical protein
VGSRGGGGAGAGLLVPFLTSGRFTGWPARGHGRTAAGRHTWSDGYGRTAVTVVDSPDGDTVPWRVGTPGGNAGERLSRAGANGRGDALVTAVDDPHPVRPPGGPGAGAGMTGADLAELPNETVAALIVAGVVPVAGPAGISPQDDWVAAAQQPLITGLVTGGMEPGAARALVTGWVTADALTETLPALLAGHEVPLRLGASLEVPLAVQMSEAAHDPDGAPASGHWRPVTFRFGQDRGQQVSTRLPLAPTGPLTVPAGGPVRRSPAGPAIAGHVHALSPLARGVSGRLFRQAAGHRAPRSLFDEVWFGQALKQLGGHLPQVTAGGWPAATGAGLEFAVHGRAVAATLLAAAQAPGGPRYVYRVGVALTATPAGQHTVPDLPPDAAEDATAIVTLTRRDAARLGYPLPAGLPDAPYPGPPAGTPEPGSPARPHPAQSDMAGPSGPPDTWILLGEYRAEPS